MEGIDRTSKELCVDNVVAMSIAGPIPWLGAGQQLSKKLRKYAVRTPEASLEEYQSRSNSAIPRTDRSEENTAAVVFIVPSARR